MSLFNALFMLLLGLPCPTPTLHPPQVLFALLSATGLLAFGKFQLAVVVAQRLNQGSLCPSHLFPSPPCSLSVV